jgi:curved DNA-binding protein
MAADFKDYYGILGVKRESTADEIRNAFRKLARKYHPDVARDKKHAEERFKEINEAYEVLSDPDKRSRYDQVGSEWRGGFGAGARSGEGAEWEGGDFTFGGTGFSEFFEQLFGQRTRVRGRAGFGFDDRGRGASMVREGADVEADLLVSLNEAAQGAVRPISVRLRSGCPQCRGGGLERGRACGACGGTGVVERVDHHQVRIPAGVQEGQRLRVAGRGETGSAGGKAGDLFLRVKLQRHPDFQVEGTDLVCELDVAPWDAVLGAELAVPTLDGEVSIRVPAGSQNGQRLRLRGRGLPVRGGVRGDLHVVLRVVLPKRVSAEVRELWEQLRARSRGVDASD